MSHKIIPSDLAGAEKRFSVKSSGKDTKVVNLAKKPQPVVVKSSVSEKHVPLRIAAQAKALKMSVTPVKAEQPLQVQQKVAQPKVTTVKHASKPKLGVLRGNSLLSILRTK